MWQKPPPGTQAAKIEIMFAMSNRVQGTDGSIARLSLGPDMTYDIGPES